MEKYSFVEEPPEDFMCMICAKLLTEPHVTECCGQHFCQSCLGKWFERQGKKICPHCRSETFTHILYLPLKRKIQALKVFCPNKKYGCGATVSVSDFKGHVEACDFATVICELGCRTSMLKKDLKQHSTNKCPKRKVNCQYCRKEDSYDFITGQHTEICDEYPTHCPRGCVSGTIKRKDLKRHADVCMLEDVQCPFYDAGCKAQTRRKDLREHLQQNQLDHLSQLVAEFSKLKSDHKKLSDEHQQLKVDHKKLFDGHEQLKTDHKMLFDGHEQLKVDHKEVSHKHEQLKEDHKKLSDEYAQVKGQCERLNSSQSYLSSRVDIAIRNIINKCSSCGEFWYNYESSHTCKRRR